MPQLKQLSCCVQWSDTNAPFREYGTAYGDGVVETFIIVPNKPQGFCIRLTSQGFIYEGLAMIVFIDGNYQCNRCRVNLKPPMKGQSPRPAEVDFLLRQKEKAQGDGMYMGREWRFDNHNIVGDPPSDFEESHFDELGTIEVLVLRCRAFDQRDADAEGSSSGQDSDVLTDRGEQVVMDVPGSGPKPQPHLAPVMEEPKIERFPDLGFGGLFDGGNDYAGQNNTAGVYDPKGKWVWQQAAAPSVQEFSAIHGGYHDQTHQFTPLYPLPPPPPDAFQDPLPPPPKHVHWDYGPCSTPGSYISPHGQSSLPSHLQPPSHRPSSTERIRHGSIQGQHEHKTTASTPYEPQRISNRAEMSERRRSSGESRPTANNNWEPTPPAGNSHEIHHKDNANLRSLSNSWEAQRASSFGQSGNTDNQSGEPESQQHEQAKPNVSGSGSFSAALQSSRPGPGETVHRPPMMHEVNQEQRYNPVYDTYKHTSSCHGFYPHGILPIPSGPMFHPQYNAYWSMPYPGPYGYYRPGPPDGQGFSNHPASADEHPSPKTTHPIGSSQNPDNGGPGDGGGSNGQRNDWGGDPAGGLDNNNFNQNHTTTGGNENSDYNWNNQDATIQNNTGPDNQNGPTWAGDQASGRDDNIGDDNQFQTHNSVSDWKNDINDNSGVAKPNIESSKPVDDQNDGESSLSVGMDDTCRNLYGPHGPYYTMRALDLDEPEPDAGEEPRYDVPKSIAKARRSTKQVQPGPGYRYYKRRIIPEYVDDLQNPYARFVFKYRTKKQLTKEVGIEVDVDPTGSQEIQYLQDIDKQTLIEMLIRAKGALGGKVPSPPPAASTPVYSEKVRPGPINAPNRSYLKYTIPPHRPEPKVPEPSRDSDCSSQRSKVSVRRGNDAGSGGAGNGSNFDWGAETDTNEGIKEKSALKKHQMVNWDKLDQNSESTCDGAGDKAPVQDEPQEVQASESPPPVPPNPQIKPGEEIWTAEYAAGFNGVGVEDKNW